MPKELRAFHLAIPVFDLELAKQFYLNILGCEQGRSDKNWVDFNFFGNQLVIHLSKNQIQAPIKNSVDGNQVPVPHFGVILEWDEWGKLSEELKSKNVNFVIEPRIRFQGLPGEQCTMFFLDPCQNAIEIKAFKNTEDIFRAF